MQNFLRQISINKNMRYKFILVSLTLLWFMNEKAKENEKSIIYAYRKWKSWM